MNAGENLAVSEQTVLEACGERALPDVGVIEQVWDTDPISADQISERAGAAVRALALEDVPNGGEIAVGVGGAIDALDERGYTPFVFPAMGSHGGATAEGQRAMIESLGVTEERIGCEIRSSMAVEQAGETPDRGVPVVADANAVGSDGLLLINRIKPHTDFDGTIESGLSKMLVIGMGNQRGAKIAHEWAVDWSFRNMIPESTDQLLEALPVVGGLALVEDQHDETALIEGIRPDGFLERGAALLETAYDIMPTIPFDDVDVLVLDRQGKDISGQGLDTNVIGRRPFALNEPEPIEFHDGRFASPSHHDAYVT